MKDEEKFIEIIEYMNNIYLEKNNNKKSNKIKLIIGAIKTNNIKFALNRILKKRDYRNDNEIKTIEPYTIKNNKSNKIAVYTCITGSYDNVCEPLVRESNCDYFLFTNNKNVKSNNWKIKEIPENIKSLNDNVLINRYIKMHPHELFPEYDYCIYIDGNITIVSTISEFVNNVSKNTGLAFHTHYNKNCAYDEIKTCQIVGKGNAKKLKEQEKIYIKEGFPKNFGLFECNVIVSDTKNKTGEKILDLWWEEFKKSKSMRDQICLPYAIWKNGYDIKEIGIIAENVFLNPKIRINKHI